MLSRALLSRAAHTRFAVGRAGGLRAALACNPLRSRAAASHAFFTPVARHHLKKPTGTSLVACACTPLCEWKGARALNRTRRVDSPGRTETMTVTCAVNNLPRRERRPGGACQRTLMVGAPGGWREAPVALSAALGTPGVARGLNAATQVVVKGNVVEGV